MNKVITETIIKQLVKESLFNFLCEGADPSTYGTKGHIPVKPASELCNDIPQNILNMIDSGNRSIPKDKIGDPMYFGNTLIWKIYQQYSAMITRKDGRTAVSFFIFLNKCRHGWKGQEIVYFQNGDDYLIGAQVQGSMLAVYAAPSSLRNLLSLVKETLQYDNMIYSVTDDMASMLERMQVPKYRESVECEFRGSICQKYVFGSTQEEADKGAAILGLMHDMKTGLVPKGAFSSKEQLKESLPRFLKVLLKTPDRTLALVNLVRQRQNEKGKKVNIFNAKSLLGVLELQDLHDIATMFTDEEKNYVFGINNNADINI